MSEMSGMDKYKFRRALEQIEEAAGRGTELVSVYIPPGRAISDVTNYLRAELSQSSNIKSASTRKHVTQAIESAIQRLKSSRMPPSTGRVVPLPLRLEILHGATPRDALREGRLRPRRDRLERGDPRVIARQADRGDQESPISGAGQAPDGRPERPALRGGHDIAVHEWYEKIG